METRINPSENVNDPSEAKAIYNQKIQQAEKFSENPEEVALLDKKEDLSSLPNSSIFLRIASSSNNIASDLPNHSLPRNDPLLRDKKETPENSPNSHQSTLSSSTSSTMVSSLLTSPPINQSHSSLVVAGQEHSQEIKQQTDTKQISMSSTSYIFYQISECAGGVVDGITRLPKIFMHPENAARGVKNIIANPTQAGKAILKAFEQKPVRTITKMVAGSLFFDFAIGSIGDMAGAAADTLSTAGDITEITDTLSTASNITEVTDTLSTASNITEVTDTLSTASNITEVTDTLSTASNIANATDTTLSTTSDVTEATDTLSSASDITDATSISTAIVTPATTNSNVDISFPLEAEVKGVNSNVSSITTENLSSASITPYQRLFFEKATHTSPVEEGTINQPVSSIDNLTEDVSTATDLALTSGEIADEVTSINKALESLPSEAASSTQPIYKQITDSSFIPNEAKNVAESALKEKAATSPYVEVSEQGNDVLIERHEEATIVLTENITTFTNTPSALEVKAEAINASIKAAADTTEGINDSVVNYTMLGKSGIAATGTIVVYAKKDACCTFFSSAAKKLLIGAGAATVAAVAYKNLECNIL